MSDAAAPLIDAAQIRALLAVADMSSISRAAEILSVSQPTVSQAIKRAEASFGRKIFLRRRTGVQATPDGHNIIVYARALLQLGDDLRTQLAKNAGHMQIVVGMAEDFCRSTLPNVLGILVREHRNTEVQIISGTYNSLSEAIANESVDIAVLRKGPRLLDVRHLWSDEVVWVGHPDVPLPIEDPVPLCLAIDGPAREAAIAALNAAGRPWRIAFQSNTLTGLEAALQARLGVAALPSSMQYLGVCPLGAENGLPPVPPADYVIYQSITNTSPVVQAFVSIISAAVQYRPSSRMNSL